jgi:hypothetical protein
VGAGALPQITQVHRVDGQVTGKRAANVLYAAINVRSLSLICRFSRSRLC